MSILKAICYMVVILAYLHDLRVYDEDEEEKGKYCRKCVLPECLQKSHVLRTEGG